MHVGRGAGARGAGGVSKGENERRMLRWPTHGDEKQLKAVSN